MVGVTPRGRAMVMLEVPRAGSAHERRRYEGAAGGARLIREALQRWPGLSEYLERTGLGSDPKLIQQLAARAERRPRRQPPRHGRGGHAVPRYTGRGRRLPAGLIRLG